LKTATEAETSQGHRLVFTAVQKGKFAAAVRTRFSEKLLSSRALRADIRLFYTVGRRMLTSLSHWRHSSYPIQIN